MCGYGFQESRIFHQRSKRNGSFQVLQKNLPEKSQDFVVLNSVSFFERARPFMEQHRVIRLYLDIGVPESGKKPFKCLKDVQKAGRLPRSCNRQDERLSDNRILPPHTRNSWAGDTDTIKGV
jgi:hypothetical protein